MLRKPENSGSPEPVPAVSLIVIRDGAGGLEVLMLERHRDLSFAAGAVVFPGGKIDPGDQMAARFWRYPRGRDERTRRLAGLRELFEETGLLLAEDSRTGRTVGEPLRARLARRYRHKIGAGSSRLDHMAKREDLLFGLESLVPFAHWITPTIAPKRFDTRFYLVAAPRGQRATPDGGEATGLIWRHPRDIITAGMAGEFRLMFPTRVNLHKLAEASSVSDACRRARQQPLPTVLPEVRINNGKKTIHIPADVGYGAIQSTEQEADTR